MSTPPPQYTPLSPTPTNLQHLQDKIRTTRAIYNQHKRLRTLLNNLRDFRLQTGELEELDNLAWKIDRQGYDNTLAGVEATCRKLNGDLGILEKMELDMERRGEAALG